MIIGPVETETKRISLRPATQQDGNLLLEIYASTRADELALVPWTAEQKATFVRMQSDAQHEHYRKKYPRAGFSVIVVDQRAAGRLYLAENESEIRILDLTLLPNERNHGVGTILLRKLIEEATKKKKALRIFVESFNPALRLFERLGFSKLEEHGIYSLMERLPTTMEIVD